MKTYYTTIITVLTATSSAYTEAARYESTARLNFVEVEGNKCTCNTNADCAPNEYCKISNCNDHGYSGGRCKPNSNPPPPRQPQCYNYGQHCNKDSDCLTGGFNPCTTCSSNNKCYTPEQPQCYNLGQHCNTNSDCHTGGFNPCTTCGQYVGTEYYKRCFTPDYEDEDEDTLDNFVEEESSTESQCYNHGQHCKRDSDCWTGGYNPCTTCSSNNKCYTPETPAPSPADVGQCGVPCTNNHDCKSQYVGTYNPCTLCSKYGGAAGTQWVCIDPTEMDEYTYAEEESDVKYLRASRK